MTPFQKFVKIESLSGLLLFGATIIALIWANSPWRDVYESLWQYKLGFESQGFTLVKPLILWVNDGLMTLFFLLIGLEIKREILLGELNTPRKAAFPVFGAIGGMLIPILLFLLFNDNPAASHGWGVPMATDIAFTLAILKTLGSRVPVGLKVFLTAFAIVDDLGAVLVIALFYSENVVWAYAGIAMIPLAILFLLGQRRIFSPYLLAIVGVIVWFLFLKSGLHPTIAGILLAFCVPIRRLSRLDNLPERLDNIRQRFGEEQSPDSPLMSSKQIGLLNHLADLVRQVQSPLQHLELTLHNWVAYLVIPIFALANAGVYLGGETALDLGLALTLAGAMIAGNAIGVSVLSLIGVRTGIASLPAGVNNRHILGVAFLAGVGFTMSIFIANLAFVDSPQVLSSAKLGILAASLISGLIGWLILRGGPRVDTA